MCQEPDDEADSGLQQRCTKNGPGQDLERENYLFDVADIARNQHRRTANAFRENVEHNQPDKED